MPSRKQIKESAIKYDIASTGETPSDLLLEIKIQLADISRIQFEEQELRDWEMFREQQEIELEQKEIELDQSLYDL